MAAMNDVTGDSLISRGFSKQGEANFEAIFGKRTTRNRPLEENKSTGNSTEQGIVPRHSESSAI